MLDILLEFGWKLLTGDVYRVWKEYKLWEADNAKKQAESLSDGSAIAELQAKWRR